MNDDELRRVWEAIDRQIDRDFRTAIVTGALAAVCLSVALVALIVAIKAAVGC